MCGIAAGDGDSYRVVNIYGCRREVVTAWDRSRNGDGDGFLGSPTRPLAIQGVNSGGCQVAGRLGAIWYN